MMMLADDAWCSGSVLDENVAVYLLSEDEVERCDKFVLRQKEQAVERIAGIDVIEARSVVLLLQAVAVPAEDVLFIFHHQIVKLHLSPLQHALSLLALHVAVDRHARPLRVEQLLLH